MPAKPQPDVPNASSALLEIMTSLAAEHDHDRLFDRILQSSCELLDAERSTLFLLDHEKKELWSKVTRGGAMHEIRLPIGKGIAGHVAATGETLNIPDAYQDARFNPDVDKQTGYRTRSILCMPMRNRRAQTVGVLQVLNRRSGPFTEEDEKLLGAFAAQAAVAWENALLVEDVQRRIHTSEILLNVMASVSSELELNQLLRTIVVKTSESMQAERCTLFLIDKKTGELFSRVAQGEGMAEIRIPGGAGIAGHVATTGETVNIPDCYKDSRFNPEVDRKTGYRTRNMLCMPIRDEKREIIGVLQVLNRKRGPFGAEDERLLDALGSQMAVSLQNSQLFEEVLFVRNYNDGILRSIATSVVTVDPDGGIAYTNTAGLNLAYDLEHLEMEQHFSQFFGGAKNPEFVAGVRSVLEGASSFTAYDLRYHKVEDESLNVNVHVFPLRDSKDKSLGLVVVADDITQEQRLMSTLCRYVTRSVAEQVLAQRDEMRLGGKRSRVAVLFSDIRNFTTMSERISAEEVVGVLNEYFSAMIEPIFHHEGTLDKYIGDAIMAVFGAPVAHSNDAERAVRAALEMRRALHRLNEARSRRGLPPIETGIGITLGEAVSGNIGGEQRMDYTVIGDTVNLASRLEGLTKEFDTKIIINEDVYREIQGSIVAVDLGTVQVKGKEDAVRIYGVPDLAEQRRHARREMTFEVAYELDGEEVKTTGADISQSGLSFHSDRSLPPDLPLVLRFRLSSEDWEQVRCAIRSTQQGRIGVSFLDADPEVQQRLQKAVVV